ncbi:MAG: threonine/serine exporter family protein [Gemmatimonadales bacterium]|nr:threonine/serine exporter family protein [Gemmatimonadales bacterium]
MAIPPALRQGDDRIGFVLQLGRSLHVSGYDAHRLEEAMEMASDKLGLRGQFFSTPTSIMSSFGVQDDQQTFLIRVRPGETNLGKLAQVDAVTHDVLEGRKTPSQGLNALARIEAAPPPYGPVLTTLAFGLSSGTVAQFLGGARNEVIAGFTIGMVIGLLSLLAARLPALGRVFAPVAAAIAAAAAAGIAVSGMPISVFTATLAGVIVLIPGLTLTTALTELSSQHLASGTARFMGAVVTLLGIAFGIAVGGKVMSLLVGPAPQLAAVVPLPGWSVPIALVILPLAFMVLLRAEWRDAPWIMMACLLAFFGTRLGARVLGAELGAFVGAFATALGSNWYARITNRPAPITLVPGLLLMVPGSIGIRSLDALVASRGADDVIGGVDSAFKMVLIAISLVSGILIANAVSPRRRLLS